MPNEETGQFNYPIPKRLKTKFNEITVGKKQQDVVVKLVEAFVRDPSIAGVYDRKGSHNLSPADSIGLVDVIEDFRDFDFTDYFEDAYPTYIFIRDYAAFRYRGFHWNLITSLSHVGPRFHISFPEPTDDIGRALVQELVKGATKHGGSFTTVSTRSDADLLPHLVIVTPKLVIYSLDTPYHVSNVAYVHDRGINEVQHIIRTVLTPPYGVETFVMDNRD